MGDFAPFLGKTIISEFMVSDNLIVDKIKEKEIKRILKKGKKDSLALYFTTFATFWTQFVTERVGINYLQI